MAYFIYLFVCLLALPYFQGIKYSLKSIISASNYGGKWCLETMIWFVTGVSLFLGFFPSFHPSSLSSSPFLSLPPNFLPFFLPPSFLSSFFLFLPPLSSFFTFLPLRPSAPLLFPPSHPPFLPPSFPYLYITDHAFALIPSISILYHRVLSLPL